MTRAGTDREHDTHHALKSSFERSFASFHDLKVETRSLHGHKHFTAWEWTVTCKPSVGADAAKISKAKGIPIKVIGCTLVWWDDDDKMVRNHEYARVPGPEERGG